MRQCHSFPTVLLTQVVYIIINHLTLKLCLLHLSLFTALRPLFIIYTLIPLLLQKMLPRIVSCPSNRAHDACAAWAHSHFRYSAPCTDCCPKAFALPDPLAKTPSPQILASSPLGRVSPAHFLLFPMMLFLSSKCLGVWRMCLFICSLLFHLSSSTTILTPERRELVSLISH